MRIYLAGGSAEMDLCASYMTRLRDAGHDITYDWAGNVRKVGAANPRGASECDRQAWSLDDLDGVRAAETFWLLVPEKLSIGCWVEFGVAFRHSATRRLIVSGDWRKTIFTSLADERYDTHEEAFEAIAQQRKGAA